MLTGQGRPLGVLVIGAGGIADLHTAAIDRHPGCTLVGFVDTAPTRAREAARRAGGVRWTTNLNEALAWPEVDACVVCTPNSTHADLGIEVARAGKHLLLEKPLATSMADTAFVREFAERGLALMVAHTHRFYDYAVSIKNAIDAGTVGRPVLVRLALLGGWIWPDWRSWILDVDRSGGHELHNGVHVLDLVTWWIGRKPVSVYARGQRRTAAELDIDDYLELVVEYDGGAVAICEMSRAHRPANLSLRDVVVQGTGGLLTIPWDAEGTVLADERGTSHLPAAGSDAFTDQLDAWLSVIRGERPAQVAGGPEATLAVALSVAARRSIATGRPVQVADVLAEVA